MGKLYDTFRAFIGNYYDPPTPEQKKGDSPYTRSGKPPPKLDLPHGEKNIHHENNAANLRMHMDKDYEKTRHSFSDPQRQWRKKILLDQRLHPDEPIRVDVIWRPLNPLRRLYRYPLDTLYVKFLEPAMGPFYATVVRMTVPKGLMVLGAILVIHYHLKYESKKWTQFIGTYNVRQQEIYPNLEEIRKENPGLYELGVDPPKKKQDFYDFQFQKRAYLRDLGDTQRPW